MEYIEQKIGDEYKKWGRGNLVMITAPTGSGKSYFILHVLLKHAIRTNARIAYFVNRKILKSQLQEEITYEIKNEFYKEFGKVIPVENYIAVMTYQSIEAKLKCGDFQGMEYFLRKFDYVVYDECHYFHMDSNYNTATEVSYEFLRYIFDDKVQIFISATMKKMRDYICNYMPVFPSVPEIQRLRTKGSYIYEYNTVADYSYLNVRIFGNLLELNEIIRDNLEDKWLVFTDSIGKGHSFKELLLKDGSKDNLKNIPKEEVVFIDADYKKDEDAASSVDELNKNKLIKKKIVIATAVMDNGISFHDLLLRNIVILADTEEEFVQMLGRKRQDMEQVNLYICQRDEDHFRRRRRYIDRAIMTYNIYSERIKKMYPPLYGLDGSIMKYKSPYMVDKENLFIYPFTQQNIVDDMMQDEVVYSGLRKFVYFYRGVLAVNSLSVDRLYDLVNYYSDLEEKLKDDPLEFVKTQLRWLHFSEEQITEIIKKSLKSQEDEFREKIKVLCEVWKGRAMTGEENMLFKGTVRRELIYFLSRNASVTNTDVEDVGKTKRTISPERFNLCMETAELPYRMKKVNRSTFMIEITEPEEK